MVCLFFSLSGRNDYKGLVCCPIKDALLYTSIVKRSYLSYCCFPINSKTFAHSPLIYTSNKVHSLEYFLQFPGNTRVRWECISSTVFEIFRSACRRPTSMLRSRSLRKLFFYSYTLKEIQHSPINMFKCIIKRIARHWLIRKVICEYIVK